MMSRSFLAGLLMLGVAGCATPEASIMLSPHNNWLAVGYDESRSDSILKTQRTAERHCQTQSKQMQLLSTVTVYQGQVPEEVNAAAKAARDAAWVYGDFKGSELGRTLSSDTDYKTTIEFRCE